ncbi:MAG: N-formylglutamate amidohydrolase [Rhizomicrobium sp.]
MSESDISRASIEQPAPAQKAATDPALARLHAEPFSVISPALRTAPFVFASPHSGRLYPASFVAASRLGPTSLRRSEDAFVDELFVGAVECGAPLIAASFPRAYLDVNRAPGELDASMFDAPLDVASDAAGPRVQAGLGVIPRIVRDGAEIYRGRLAACEAGERLNRFYRPYHAALAQLIEETRARFGFAVLVDCHSMPSAAAVPDIVLGDRYGISAAAPLMRAAERMFARHGFSIARNSPYAGGYTTHLYGRPARGVHALQVEINRSLYLDEERVARAATFAGVQQRIARALTDLMAMDFSLLRPGGGSLRHAAE